MQDVGQGSTMHLANCHQYSTDITYSKGFEGDPSKFRDWFMFIEKFI